MTLEREIFTQACRLHFGITTHEQKDALEKLALLVAALQHETITKEQNTCLSMPRQTADLNANSPKPECTPLAASS